MGNRRRCCKTRIHSWAQLTSAFGRGQGVEAVRVAPETWREGLSIAGFCVSQLSLKSRSVERRCHNRGFSRNLKAMEVHFTPETEKKLKDLSTQSGRGTDDLVEDAMAGYFDEVLQAREMLDSRYDDLKSGRVKPISRDEVIAHFREKSDAQRNRPA